MSEKSPQQPGQTVQPSSEQSQTWVYVAISIVILALMVAGVARHRDQEQTDLAKAKATELVTKLNAAGLKAPSEEAAVRLFGADGGPYAANPDQALLQSQYAWQLGTGGVAGRPGILDPDFVKAAQIFVSVYAPEKSADFTRFVDGLKTGQTQ